jgi:hypothetical protein
VFKDSWKEICRDMEVHFYQHIEKHAGEGGWKGVARCEGSIDLGKSELEYSGHVTCSAALPESPIDWGSRSQTANLWLCALSHFVP